MSLLAYSHGNQGSQTLWHRFFSCLFTIAGAVIGCRCDRLLCISQRSVTSFPPPVRCSHCVGICLWGARGGGGGGGGVAILCV